MDDAFKDSLSCTASSRSTSAPERLCWLIFLSLYQNTSKKKRGLVVGDTWSVAAWKAGQQHLSQLPSEVVGAWGTCVHHSCTQDTVFLLENFSAQRHLLVIKCSYMQPIVRDISDSSPKRSCLKNKQESFFSGEPLN